MIFDDKGDDKGKNNPEYVQAYLPLHEDDNVPGYDIYVRYDRYEECKEKYQQYYQQKRTEVYYREYMSKFDALFNQTNAVASSRIEAQKWAKNFPDNEAREYARDCVVEYQRERFFS